MTAAFGWVLASQALLGQDAKPRPAALAIDEPIVVDGAIEEAVWRDAEVASDFTQREPYEGTPATERTEVRVAFTKSVLYLSVHAFDSVPEGVVAKEMERDATLYRDDSVVFVLDTFGDHRNGYAFETNPNGARFDALVTDEGRDVNVHWDGVWDAAARRTADGWSAELAIPFSTVRFDPGQSTWGLNVRRMIRRKNEEVNWTPLSRSIGDYRDLSRYAVYRISMAGELTGLVDLEPSRRLGVTPFLVGDLSQSPGTGQEGTEDDAEAGLDVKWGIGRSTSLDLTYNTDFAEVEVDQQQVNLTRFSLFFPEKRDFFLENAGIFEFGLPNRETLEPALMKVFFSRRMASSRAARCRSTTACASPAARGVGTSARSGSSPRTPPSTTASRRRRAVSACSASSATWAGARGWACWSPDARTTAAGATPCTAPTSTGSRRARSTSRGSPRAPTTTASPATTGPPAGAPATAPTTSRRRSST
jgi:hypothetical protein